MSLFFWQIEKIDKLLYLIVGKPEWQTLVRSGHQPSDALYTIMVISKVVRKLLLPPSLKSYKFKQ